MLVETVETRFVHDIDDRLFGFGDGERRVAGSYLAVSLYAEHRTEVGALLRIACSVSCHRDLAQCALHLMRYLGCQCYLTVDIALQTDGNQFVRVRGKVFPCDESAVTLITVSDDGRVDI